MNRKEFKDLSYDGTVSKLKEYLELLGKYTDKSLDLPSNFDYKETVMTINYLRNRARCVKNRRVE